jgi:hypothetical protein
VITFTLPSSPSSSNSSSSSNLFWHLGCNTTSSSPFNFNFRQFSEIASSTLTDQPIPSTSTGLYSETDENVKKGNGKKKFGKRIQNFFSKFL